MIRSLFRRTLAVSRSPLAAHPDRPPPRMTYYNETCNDRWIVESVFPHKRNGYFVEAGAATGKGGSSCYVLETKLHWRGLCIEPNDEFFGQLQRNRPRSICEQVCLAEKPGTVTFIQGENDLHTPYLSGIKSHLEQYKSGSEIILSQGRTVTKAAVTLASLLQKHNAPRVIDYAAFDIEGSEYAVLSTFPFDQYRFLALSLECDEWIWERLKPTLVTHGYREVRNSFNPDKIWEKYCLHESLG